MKWQLNHDQLAHTGFLIAALRGYVAATCLIAACAVSLPAQSALAQASPFGDAPPTSTDDESADAVSDETPQFDKLVAAETDPLVLMVLETRPETPQEWIQDIRTLLNLKRPEFAKEYLAQFLADEISDDQLAMIQARFGTALFLRLLNVPEIQPEGMQAAERVMKAAHAQIQNEQRLESLVAQLSDPEPANRRLAVMELVKAGAPAAVPLIAVLVDSTRQSEHAKAQAALVALGDEGLDPIIAALNTTDPSSQRSLVAVLKKVRARTAVPALLPLAYSPTSDAQVASAAKETVSDLLGALPSREQAIAFLQRRFDDFLGGNVPGTVDQNGQVSLWIWDNAQQTLRQQNFKAADASCLAAAVIAEHLHRIDAENAAFEETYLVTGLEVAKRINGYDRAVTAEMGTIHSAISAADPALLEAVLERSEKMEMPGAAIAALEFLSQKGGAELLASQNGKPRLLAAALMSPLRGVKYAAARAIVKLDPTAPYAGSSYLPTLLGHLSASGGERRLLVGHPRVEEAQRIAGLAQQLGFEADTSQSGRQLVLQAFANPDYSLILVHDALNHPRYRDIINSLRQDPRTAATPVGLIARDVNEEAAEWFARTDPLTLSLASPRTEADLKSDITHLMDVAGHGQISADARLRQAQFALETLAHYAEEPEKYGYYELLALDEQMEEATRTPHLSITAARMLGLLGTPRAQRALIEIANAESRPIDERQAAAAAFRTAVSRRGLLLTREQLLRQYELYNASQFLDSDTQKVLSSLLDTMESRAKSAESAKQ